MRPTTLAILATLLAGLTTPALANEVEPDNAIKFRQNAMKAIGGATGNIGAILKGDVSHADQMAHLAELLAEAARPEYTLVAFGQNTADQGFAQTTALPKIWENWDDFESRLRKLGEVTSAAAEAGDAVSMAEMKPVFETCKGCHDEYREKK